MSDTAMTVGPVLSLRPSAGRTLVREVLSALVVLAVGAFVLGRGMGWRLDWLPLPGGMVPETISVVPAQVRVAAVAVAACLMWTRRRRPMGLLVATAVTTLVVPAVVGAVAVALAAVAVRCRLMLVAAATVLAVVPLAGYCLVDPESLWLLLAGGPVYLVALAGGLMARSRRQFVASLAERARRAEAEQRLRVEQGRRRERERIAREMHDALGHRLSLLAMAAGAVEFRADMPADERARCAAAVRSAAHGCLDELREILAVLRTEEEGGARGLPDVPGLVDGVRRAGADVTLTDRIGDGAALPAQASRDAYRIVQEGLTNAGRHAPGQPVRVVLAGGPGQGVGMEIRNGPPTPSGRAEPGGGGLGLAGLSERARLGGGRLEHGYTADGGYRLAAWLPWPV